MRIMPSLTFTKAKEAALQGILLCDASQSRKLNFAGFAQFVMNFCGTSSFLAAIVGLLTLLDHMS